MITRDPEALADVVVEAARLARTALPAEVFLLEECPHSWLFPRVQAAIHHGGGLLC